MSTDVDPDAEDGPERIVYLSPYLIDKYEVSNGRYKECIDAGVCNEPDENELYPWDNPDYADMPVAHITKADALTFCNWDGGRTLPTEAQWEKAAKGPYPEQKIWPWGDSPEISCDLVLAITCPGNPGGITYLPVDSTPEGASYYGLFHTLGNVKEMCLDSYSDNAGTDLVGFDPYYTDPQSDLESCRGPGSYIWDGDPILNINQHSFIHWGESVRYAGFRCARRAY
ncbi:formylglycine-generating enzyme family protein [Myxococcota bacterium]|nr:formylglycine-generating enzyme family protein [Myxococcota bacterium]MBU1534855.1 formylglycine-generating enzyme family protein [Myxococcota bacterium]